jgi:hypothetical protein
MELYKLDKDVPDYDHLSGDICWHTERFAWLDCSIVWLFVKYSLGLKNISTGTYYPR